MKHSLVRHTNNEIWSYVTMHVSVKLWIQAVNLQPSHGHVVWGPGANTNLYMSGPPCPSASDGPTRPPNNHIPIEMTYTAKI